VAAKRVSVPGDDEQICPAFLNAIDKIFQKSDGQLVQAFGPVWFAPIRHRGQTGVFQRILASRALT